MKAPLWIQSLRLRLLGATLVTLTMALAGAHWWLSGLFRDHVWQQFDVTLVQQLDQLTGQLEFDADGQVSVTSLRLSDPRWDKPYSGLYWQLDQLSSDGQTRRGVLRSRSLWDAELDLEADPLADGHWHGHEALGPNGENLRVVERAVQATDQTQAGWRLIVAADPGATLAAVDRFNGVLAASLGALGLLLGIAALAQVGVGLAPLAHMQRALQRVRDGETQRLEGQFPSELQALIHDFNGVLDRNSEVVARARTQAGNLAHALKTPLAVLGNASQQSAPSELGSLVSAQVQVAQRHIDWHLARSRAAAAQHLPGQRTALKPVIEGLARVMSKLHADRHLHIDTGDVPDNMGFAGEEQDLQEMLGNLLDNACRSARNAVQIQTRVDGATVLITVDDDGPGIATDQRTAALERGVRLDESLPGSGLGLAIVLELADLYGGNLSLQSSPLGGLRAALSLPATP